jgi:hypothetical protein
MRKTTDVLKIQSRLIPLVVVLLLLAIFLPSSPVYAAPVVSLTPSTGAVGTAVTITGTVFDSYKGDNIHIFFDTSEIENSPIVVPPEGVFSTEFTIPAASAAGQHWIEVRSETTSTSMLAKNYFTVEPAALSLNINQGTVGSLVTLSGSGFYVDKSISVSYTALTPDELGTVNASSTGRFTYQFPIPASAAGFHKIVASNDVGNSAEIEFKVLPSFKLNLDSAGPGDAVTAGGTGFAGGSPVAVIFGSLGVANVLSDEFGSFEIDFYVPPFKPLPYSVRAQDIQGNTDKVEFTITAGAALSENIGATGTDLTVTGSNFEPGQTVTVYYDDIPVATAAADNNGDFSATFPVPPGGGNHMITVSDGDSTKKYTFSLETDPPPVPALLLPADTSMTKAEAYFDWSDVTDISTPVTYNLEIAGDLNFASRVLIKTGITESEYTLLPGEVLAAEFKNAPYFWKIKAVDGAGNESDWSDPMMFYVSVPPVPSLILPAAEAPVELPIHFSWQAASSLSPPVTYHLQIAANPDFAAPILDKTGIAVAEYLLTEEGELPLEDSLAYFWRIQTTDNARNSGEWSPAGSFIFISASGFPAWATYMLISVGCLIAILIAFRAGRRMAYRDIE